MIDKLHAGIFAAGLLLGLVIGAMPGPAKAEQVVLSSTEPYWKVGDKDDALSRACATGHFGMKAPGRYAVRFNGTEGAAHLGLAKGSGLNLYDPDKRAKPEEDYFFRAHGTSSCEVYVGGRKPPEGGEPAPAAKP